MSSRRGEASPHAHGLLYGYHVAYIIHRTAASEPRTPRASTCARWTASIRAKDEPDFATVDQLFIHPDECIDCGACVRVSRGGDFRPRRGRPRSEGLHRRERESSFKIVASLPKTYLRR